MLKTMAYDEFKKSVKFKLALPNRWGMMFMILGAVMLISAVPLLKAAKNFGAFFIMMLCVVACVLIVAREYSQSSTPDLERRLLHAMKLFPDRDWSEFIFIKMTFKARVAWHREQCFFCGCIRMSPRIQGMLADLQALEDGVSDEAVEKQREFWEMTGDYEEIDKFLEKREEDLKLVEQKEAELRAFVNRYGVSV